MTAQASNATVPTDRAQRYGKQLVSHLGHRASGEWDDTAATGRITFEAGHADLSCTPDALLLRVCGAAADLDRLEDVVGRHLVRFGTRDELTVRWIRAGGAVGTVQRNTEE